MQIAVRLAKWAGRDTVITQITNKLEGYNLRLLRKSVKHLLEEQHELTKKQCMAELSKLKEPHGSLAVTCAQELIEGVKLV